jgi:PIN domain nuclease of toxin-antitoxin system
MRQRLDTSDAVMLQPVSVAVADATTSIPGAAFADPRERLNVATASALGIALVSRDEAIQRSGLVPTIW